MACSITWKSKATIYCCYLLDIPVLPTNDRSISIYSTTLFIRLCSAVTSFRVLVGFPSHYYFVSLCSLRMHDICQTCINLSFRMQCIKRSHSHMSSHWWCFTVQLFLFSFVCGLFIRIVWYKRILFCLPWYSQWLCYDEFAYIVFFCFGGGSGSRN